MEGVYGENPVTPFPELSVIEQLRTIWHLGVGLDAVSSQEKMERESGLHRASGWCWGAVDYNECHVFRHWNSKPLPV